MPSSAFLQEPHPGCGLVPGDRPQQGLAKLCISIPVRGEAKWERPGQVYQPPASALTLSELGGLACWVILDSHALSNQKPPCLRSPWANPAGQAEAAVFQRVPPTFGELDQRTMTRAREKMPRADPRSWAGESLRTRATRGPGVATEAVGEGSCAHLSLCFSLNRCSLGPFFIIQSTEPGRGLMGCREEPDLAFVPTELLVWLGVTANANQRSG